MHEFIIIHMKRYLIDQNFRMVYRILGLTVPRKVREVLSRKGADFSDYFQVMPNQAVPHKTHQGAIGFFEEIRNHPDTALEV